jgi:GNAT superfamily N-acetyltransferase
MEAADHLAAPEHHAANAGIMIRRLGAEELRERADELADLLIDAVDGGASVSFLPPVLPLAAVGWTLDVADALGRARMVFVAELDGIFVGTVQLIRARAPNQPHRADVAKLIVHRRFRNRGIGRALLRALEAAALEAGITLLTLDTAVESDGPLIYERLGWQAAGVIPGYFLWPTGEPGDTRIFYKKLPA